MDAFTQEMQEKLLKERDELLAKLNSEGQNFREEAMAASGRDSSDLASDDAAYRKMEALNAMDAKRLKAIEGALKRISDIIIQSKFAPVTNFFKRRLSFFKSFLSFSISSIASPLNRNNL